MRAILLNPVRAENFAGLRLIPDPAQAFGGAVDMLNVELARDLSKVGTRGGMSKLGTGTASYHFISPYTSTLLMAFRNTGSALQAETVALSGGTVSAAGTSWGGASTRVTSAITKVAPVP